MDRGRYHRIYLRSAHWKAFRRAVLAKRSSCERCGIERPFAKVLYGQDLNLHHLTYANLGRESASDVQVLCSRCHYKETFYRKFISSEKGLSRRCLKCACVYLIDSDPKPLVAIFQCPRCGLGGAIDFPEHFRVRLSDRIYCPEDEREIDAET